METVITIVSIGIFAFFMFVRYIDNLYALERAEAEEALRIENKEQVDKIRKKKADAYSYELENLSLAAQELENLSLAAQYRDRKHQEARDGLRTAVAKRKLHKAGMLR